MAERLLEEGTAPKIIRIYHDAKTKGAILGSVWLEDVPGALATAAASLARLGVNLASSSSSTIGGGELAEWGFFGETADGKPTIEEIEEVLRKTPHVVRFEFKEGRNGVVVDSLHYPLRMSTGQPAMVISRETFSGMLSHLREVYGSGGSVIIYQLGVATGRRDGEDLVRVLGQSRVMDCLPDLVNLYLAQGWGKPELVDLSFAPLGCTLRITDSFESQGVKAGRPSCHFLRGHLVGIGQAVFGRQVECIETQCVAAGDGACEFRCSEI